MLPKRLLTSKSSTSFLSLTKMSASVRLIYASQSQSCVVTTHTGKYLCHYDSYKPSQSQSCVVTTHTGWIRVSFLPILICSTLICASTFPACQYDTQLRMLTCQSVLCESVTEKLSRPYDAYTIMMRVKKIFSCSDSGNIQKPI